MESRKRPRADDADVLQSKKRAVSDSRDSSVPVNGVPDSNEPKDSDSLELFRKDAIYRQMKHYSRENDRSLAKIAELERRRNTCEAGLAALEACWAQLISTIRSLAKPDELESIDVSTRDIYDLTSHVSDDPDPHYVEVLRTKMHATERLVTSFVHLGGKQESLLLQNEAVRQCHKAQAECSTLRSEVSLLKTKLRDSEVDKDRYHEQLVATERRLDRLQSRVVASLNPNTQGDIQSSSSGNEPHESKAMPGPVLERTPSVASPRSPQSPVVNGDPPMFTEKLDDSPVDISQSTKKLLEDNAKLEQEVAELQLQLKEKVASEKLVRSHVLFTSLQQHASTLEHTVKERDLRVTCLIGEINLLRRSRVDLERSFNSITEKKGEELRGQIASRDKDIARIREQRDQHLSDLNEYKQKCSVRLHSLQEYKTLSETRSERVKTLLLEVNRLRARLAAETGDEDLLKFVLQCDTEERSYIEDLRKRLVDAEQRAAAAEKSQDIDVRRKLIEVTKQLERYQTVFGESASTRSADVQALTQQLHAKQAEIQKLHLQDQQREQAELSLYTEIEKLSAAWETLDKQAKSKALDLSSMEERLSKIGIEKAKSDNKFYAIMRNKEALELEKKTLARNLEKQGQTLERLLAQEKNSSNLAKEMETELLLLRETKVMQQNKILDLDSQRRIFFSENDTLRKQLDETKAPVQEVLAELGRKRTVVVKLEETLNKKLKEVDRQSAKLKTSVTNQSISGTAREAQLQSEVDKCMSLLKCSTCKMNMRNTVITKCMHSFCKNCVNERIASRQRKCPACNLPFSQGEVQQLYFQ
ncbi:BRE1-domain-containing protein [Irpex rosettiformis]|uniref:BRE1-domain-containing protein n=1 Tax=Irpex rosettiformis TaxID=378272 RepID=A0ACB8UF94_9APHY|nr:BRE1-domain-containing protein [Irpex rosettiformis]